MALIFVYDNASPVLPITPYFHVVNDVEKSSFCKAQPTRISHDSSVSAKELLCSTYKRAIIPAVRD